MKPSWQNSRSIRSDFIAVIGLLIVIAVIWFPFGFNVLGLVEEWDLMALLDSHVNVMPFLHQTFAIRPLVMLIFAVGHTLTPGSYLGLNFVLLLLFLVKGTLVYVLLRRLVPATRAFAFATSALFMLYPADSELFATRAIAIHTALCFYLLALLLLVEYWRRPRTLLLGLSCLALLCSLLTYEAGYPLVAFSPLVLLWLEGKVTKRVLRVAAVWYSVVLLCAIWGIVQLREVPHAMQNRLLAINDSVAFAENLRAIADNFLRAYVQNLFTGWKDAITALPNSSYILGGIIVAGVVSLVTWHFTQASEDKTRKIGMRAFLTLILAGLAIIGLGFAPYLLSPYHRVINARVFFSASFGAALIISWLIWQMGLLLRSRLAYTLMMSALIGISAMVGFDHKQELSRAAQIQQRLLAGIADQVPRVPSDVLILIFDPSWNFRLPLLFGDNSYRMEYSLKYLYNRTDIHASLCYPNESASGENRETCTLTPDQVILFYNGTKYMAYPYDKVIALNYDGWTETVSLLTTIPIEYVSPLSQIETYNPRALTTPGELPPPRVYSLFTRWPDDDPIERPLQRSVVEQFDKQITDLGWSGPQPAGGMWMVNTQAALSYALRPGTAYSISFKAAALAPDMIASLILRVNDEPISLTKHIEGYFYVFEGTIPQAVMDRSLTRTRLVFETDRAVSPQSLGMNDDPRILALLFQWLKIEPISATQNSR